MKPRQLADVPPSKPTVLPPRDPERTKKLLGDYTEELLSKAGITKEWWTGIKSDLGFAPTCNCEARKQWVNRAHAWVLGRLE